MARIFAYFDKGWREERFSCDRCGWSGATEGMVPDSYREVMDYSCPACDTMLVIVSHPTIDEIREAARNGCHEATEWLRSIERPGQREDQARRDRCRS